MEKGRLHSVESFGTLDGPGIRFVIFFQGCPLRCAFCHNPDSWEKGGGREATSEEVLNQIRSYKSFVTAGGVTFSGGEPLYQPKFLAEILKELKAEGIHTAIDTSGAVPLEDAAECIDLCSMLLLDIKSIDTEICKKLTGRGNENAFEILDYCEEIAAKPVWIRHVLIPGLTLDYDKLTQLAKKLKGYTCVQRIELLAFHKLGEYKWKELGLNYSLENTNPPTKEEMERAKKIFTDMGIKAV